MKNVIKRVKSFKLLNVQSVNSNVGGISNLARKYTHMYFQKIYLKDPLNSLFLDLSVAKICAVRLSYLLPYLPPSLLKGGGGGGGVNFDYLPRREGETAKLCYAFEEKMFFSVTIIL